MKLLIVLFLIILGIVVGALSHAAWQGQQTLPEPAGAPGIPTEFQGRLQLYLLLGQSNMSGRAPLPDDAETDPRLFVFGNDYRWRAATAPVDSAYNQVDRVSADGPGDLARYGPALAFGTAVLASRPDQAIGLIPCAKGSTAASQWQRSLSPDTLYGSCLQRANAAQAMGTLAGILVYLGENDAVDQALQPDVFVEPGTFAARFSRIVTDLRADLGATGLPLVFAQIGRHDRPAAFTAWDEIQAQQAAIDLPCARMIVTADLPLGDFVHLTVDGYRTVGRRFAEAMLALRDAGCGTP